MLDAQYVIAVHERILAEDGGLPGFSGSGPGGVDAVLARVENRVHYEDMHDPFAIAAMYAVAIARGHVFNDGNKRTALSCALAFLDYAGYPTSESDQWSDADLADIMVGVAEGTVSHAELTEYFIALFLNF
ncbi:type II toxin-antitoxin system death-on-curing family toxin [Burkholderia multivorans]|uniref:type II toxin-antitoxin system death-on-curing family toxin n=1 Tax=Burkholderia multivorans TaxID=87883 RepID=UPI000D00122A|nr:type II toxin-antitoxin system death-on-curing family toxin [Burkholderia multivorans]MBU9679720.1 type II toxin-antitoxin system death-on-curing family toxin [Burkholderia multivorans]MCL4651614.1 type II toxin-antitoxin system death-on-curing family toxin [Burkholderia multivorans]MCL4655163.1 type II toxin-antitoxin system death-on-curing family toxin [Burkholderia multivorans]MCO1343422.1 type II toxin-antitoxin system death-on-curing family toxin [Burkholderia multivorans]MCO1426120.1 